MGNPMMGKGMGNPMMGGMMGGMQGGMMGGMRPMGMMPGMGKGMGGPMGGKGMGAQRPMGAPMQQQRPMGGPMGAPMQQQRPMGMMGQQPMGSSPGGLNTSNLANAPPGMQKQMIGEKIFPMISRIHPEMAGKITGMMLEMDNSELLMLMDSPDQLKAKVDEALRVLQGTR